MGADALTSCPGIRAVTIPGSLGAANNARPVESVVTFCPPEISTTTLGITRPAESSTASVAGKPAIISCGSTIVRGVAVCALGASWAFAKTPQAAITRKMAQEVDSKVRIVFVKELIESTHSIFIRLIAGNRSDTYLMAFSLYLEILLVFCRRSEYESLL